MAVETENAEGEQRWSPSRRKLIGRALLLLVTAVSLYLLAPSMLEVFTSWRRVTELSPAWLAAVLLFEGASFLSLWEQQRVALRTSSWFTVGMSQLAGSAFGRIVPGGMAASGAMQGRMLVRAGMPGPTIASGLTAGSVLSFATLVSLPLLALPAILGGVAAPSGLKAAVYVGAGLFVTMALVGTAIFVWDRPLVVVGRGAQWLVAKARRGKQPKRDLPSTLISERDAVRTWLGRSWHRAFAASVGWWGFDYMALVAALAALGSKANPSLVLLAYVLAALLGMVPITPGGLGLVEAGLTGTLVLAGVQASDALVATLVYRLASFWLPIPAGGVAWWLFRRRYPPHPESPADGLSAEA